MSEKADHLTVAQLKPFEFTKYTQRWHWSGWWLSFRLLFVKSQYAKDDIYPEHYVKYKIRNNIAYIVGQGIAVRRRAE